MLVFYSFLGKLVVYFMMFSDVKCLICSKSLFCISQENLGIINPLASLMISAENET